MEWFIGSLIYVIVGFVLFFMSKTIFESAGSVGGLSKHDYQDIAPAIIFFYPLIILLLFIYLTGKLIGLCLGKLIVRCIKRLEKYESK
jgi:NhaP-type Na+/H+ or K+/H+ antiporter